MIDWQLVEIGEELEIILIEDDGIAHDVVVKLVEYEWAPNRTPFIADLVIIRARSKKLKVGNTIKLPILTHEDEGFLVNAPCALRPVNEFKMHAKIVLSEYNEV